MVFYGIIPCAHAFLISVHNCDGDGTGRTDCSSTMSTSSMLTVIGSMSGVTQDRKTERATSLLDKLKALKASDLARKYKIVVNPPCGKYSCKTTPTTASAITMLVNVQPQQRVREFPGEQFELSNEKLFCLACREEVNLKKSCEKNHVQSAKHKDSKSKLERREKREQLKHRKSSTMSAMHEVKPLHCHSRYIK